ncbi:MAG: hypothetical protein IJY61_03660 [Candidatus Gastranaerophilales bacterium]|nr:hypothetical protein [Candidatus Gastranaerophilales bacterium]
MSLSKPGIDTRHVIEKFRNARQLASIANEGDDAPKVDTAKTIEEIRQDKEKPPVVICTKDDLINFKQKCEGKTQDEILSYLGIEATYNENGSKTLSHYKWPFKGYSFAAAGIDETKLLDGVTEIKGDCNLTGSSLKDLGSVSKIGGTLVVPLFTNAKDLSSIQSIGRDIYCDVNNHEDAVELLKKLKLDNCKIGGYIRTGDFSTSYCYPIQDFFTPKKNLEGKLQDLAALQAKHSY